MKGSFLRLPDAVSKFLCLALLVSSLTISKSAKANTLTGKDVPVTSQLIDISDLGDLNADGFDEVLTGMPFQNTFRGRVRIEGNPDGTPLTPSGSLEYNGSAISDRLGTQVESLGVDIDGDGFSEVVLSIPGYQSGQGDGRIEILSPGRLYNTGINFILCSYNSTVNQTTVEDFGFSLAVLKNSALPTNSRYVAVGAPQYETAQFTPNGRVVLLRVDKSGSSCSISYVSQFISTDHNSQDVGMDYGFSVANAEDINLDGSDELIISSPNEDVIASCSSCSCNGQSFQDNGIVRVYNGAKLAQGGTAPSKQLGNDIYGDTQLTGSSVCLRYQQFRNFGFSVSGSGDSDEDGAPEILVGAKNENFIDPSTGGVAASNAGAAFVFKFNTAGSTWDTIPQANFNFGHENSFYGKSVAAIGDMRNIQGPCDHQPGGTCDQYNQLAYLIGGDRSPIFFPKGCQNPNPPPPNIPCRGGMVQGFVGREFDWYKVNQNTGESSWYQRFDLIDGQQDSDFGNVVRPIGDWQNDNRYGFATSVPAFSNPSLTPRVQTGRLAAAYDGTGSQQPMYNFGGPRNASNLGSAGCTYSPAGALIPQLSIGSESSQLPGVHHNSGTGLDCQVPSPRPPNCSEDPATCGNNCCCQAPDDPLNPTNCGGPGQLPCCTNCQLDSDDPNATLPPCCDRMVLNVTQAPKNALLVCWAGQRYSPSIPTFNYNDDYGLYQGSIAPGSVDCCDPNNANDYCCDGDPNTVCGNPNQVENRCCKIAAEIELPWLVYADKNGNAAKTTGIWLSPNIIGLIYNFQCMVRRYEDSSGQTVTIPWWEGAHSNRSMAAAGRD